MSKKQSVLLGLRDKVEGTFKNMILDMHQKFKNNQGIFMGKIDTYAAEEGFADDPTKRATVRVGSTVAEQLAWFKEHTADFFTTVLSVEKTNSTGPKAHLIVDDQDWGEFTTLELLRLKSIVDGPLKTVIGEIPIRPENVFWKISTHPEYAGKQVFESPVDEGYAKTTRKSTVIVNDPHVKEAEGRAPVAAIVEEQVNVGKYARTNYTGMMSNLERANLQVKLDKVHKAIVTALEEANNVESQTSTLGTKFLDYMF